MTRSYPPCRGPFICEVCNDCGCAVDICACCARSIAVEARAAVGNDPVATGRAEHEPCQRGTVGCSVDHRGDTDCRTW